ncbi:MucR family transcriptional regulator, partial [Sinorhizobium medicae]|nr:MucR family transcriptional regulator [Sinorhizobium medicae]
ARATGLGRNRRQNSPLLQAVRSA